METLDCEKIRIENAKISIESLMNLFNESKISLQLDVNKMWNTTKQSKLIESIILKIPFPAIVLHIDDIGKYTIINGHNRITAIYEFINNKLRLEGLDFTYPEIEGKLFIDIKKYVRHRILNTEIPLIVIFSQDNAVKLNLFTRYK